MGGIVESIEYDDYTGIENESARFKIRGTADLVADPA